MNRIPPFNQLPPPGSSHKVTIWSENGKKVIQIKIQPQDINNDCTNTIEEVSSEVLSFIRNNLERNFTRHLEGPKIILELPDSGGREFGSIFSSGLMRSQGELHVLLSIQRISDISGKTCSWYNIPCSPKIDENLTRIKDAVKDLIVNSSQILRERACLRSEFHRLRAGNTN